MTAPARPYRSGDVALVRAAARPAPPVSSWPPPTAPITDQVKWLRAVWADSDFAESLRHASPPLARQVDVLCSAEEPGGRDLRRAVVSVSRYLLRSAGRATPFGLFAGVAVAPFGATARAEWGTEHQAVVRAGAEGLADVIGRLEACPALLTRLPVVANNTVVVRGDQLIVPHQPQRRGGQTGAVDAHLSYKAPVRAALDGARTPLPFGDLVAKLRADFPRVGEQVVTGLLATLVRHGALLTGLRAPSTETDALACLVAQLDSIGAENVEEVAGLIRELREVHAEITACNGAPLSQGREARHAAAVRMAGVAHVRQHPLAVDLRLDASLALPRSVAEEVERAAAALARLSAAPYGSAAWKAYHMRFYERFGLGSMVPVADVVADSGVGYPDSYAEDADAELRPRLTARDEALLRLAQGAALDGADEVVIDQALLDNLHTGPVPRLPPHLEVNVRIHCADLAALERGVFELEVVSVSRGVGVGTGRFLSVLDDAGRAKLAAQLADLPTSDPDTIPVQLSYPPLAPETAHVTRAPCVLSTLVSLGEYRPPQDAALGVDDLAVSCDGTRMVLAAPALGRRVEPVGMHALSLHGHHAPPLARFLSELSRAQYAQVTAFDWGIAARSLPFLPRLRYGRTVLSPARWRLEPHELATRAAWETAFAVWRERYRLPRHIYLTEGDRRLALDLDVEAHRALLRIHLDRGKSALLTEARNEAGWCGGRAHEVVVPLKACEPFRWPSLPQPTPARIIRPDRAQIPAISHVLLAALYGDIRRQDTILARHLPDLLEQLGSPQWWYVRFRDPDQHLRLRIALPTPEAFQDVAHTVSTWAAGLNKAGLLREIRYPTSYPETGRWGAHLAWDAAEEVFRADSHTLLTQLRQPTRPSQRALAAAHAVSIACAFHGSTAKGMRWLIDHIPPPRPHG
ncbi:lantibiotic dehydratase [Streptomyces sp. NPDC051578]|uniref:lantibiotic dehydratase n=1 Tax=Streptomyces sp. NPDC051578 TaxID=3365662 RepID=UPI0037A3AAC4